MRATVEIYAGSMESARAKTKANFNAFYGHSNWEIISERADASVTLTMTGEVVSGCCSFDAEETR